MTGTLSDMTVEQLRDLAKRAEATLKEKEAAKVAAEAAERAKKVVRVDKYEYDSQRNQLYFYGEFCDGVSLHNSSFIALLNDCYNAKDRLALGNLLVAIGGKAK